MFHLSLRIIYNQHDVEDALITAFSKIFRSIGNFEYRGESSLTKWIKTIVINESIRILKSKPTLSYSEDLTEYESTDFDNADLSGVDIDRIYAIIGAMPDGYRTVFNLFAIEGYSHKEIADLLNIAENTSKSQLRKARIYIIEKLKTTQGYETTK